MFNKLLSAVKEIKISRGILSHLLKVLTVVFIGGIFFWGYNTLNKPPVIPEEVINQGLQNTVAAKSFRFKLDYKTVAEDKKEDILSKIEGEREAQDKIHIKGEMLRTPVEIFQEGNVTYIKNSIGTWTVLDENDIHQQELLVNEVNPLAVFQFKEIPEVKYVGLKEFNGEEYHVIEYVPNIANQFLEVLASDYVFESWVNAKTKLIGKTIVEAKSKGAGKGKLIINIEFFDFNKDIKVNPPKLE